jgi:hypothetical protein
MRLLLDTHVFLWYITGDERLPQNFRKSIEESDAAYLSGSGRVIDGRVELDAEFPHPGYRAHPTGQTISIQKVLDDLRKRE